MAPCFRTSFHLFVWILSHRGRKRLHMRFWFLNSPEFALIKCSPYEGAYHLYRPHTGHCIESWELPKCSVRDWPTNWNRTTRSGVRPTSSSGGFLLTEISNGSPRARTIRIPEIFGLAWLLRIADSLNPAFPASLLKIDLVVQRSKLLMCLQTIDQKGLGEKVVQNNGWEHFKGVILL